MFHDPLDSLVVFPGISLLPPEYSAITARSACTTWWQRSALATMHWVTVVELELRIGENALRMATLIVMNRVHVWSVVELGIRIGKIDSE